MAMQMLSEHAKTLPVFMGHGTADPVVAFEKGKGSYLFLKEQFGLLAVESSQVCMFGHPADDIVLKLTSLYRSQDLA